MRFIRGLTPSTARNVGIDALFLLALTFTALAGLGSTYTGGGYLAVAEQRGLLLRVAVDSSALLWLGGVLAVLALAWVAAKPGVTSVILGARTQDQLADNLASADLELTAAELSRLDDVSAPTFSDYPYGGPGIEQRSRVIGGGR